MSLNYLGFNNRNSRTRNEC